ncbi:MAG: hypothetical protein ACOCX4_08295 [Planctomycetota bacterium]
MRNEQVKTFLLGVIATLLLVVVVLQVAGGARLPAAMQPAYGASQSAAAAGFIAIYDDQGHNLFVIDTANKRVVAYEFSDSSGELLLKTVRNIEYDLKGTDFSHRKGLSYNEVRDALRNK